MPVSPLSYQEDVRTIQWGNQGVGRAEHRGRMNPPVRRSPLNPSPHEMTLCTGVYGQPINWALVSPSAKMQSLPFSPHILKSLVLPLLEPIVIYLERHSNIVINQKLLLIPSTIYFSCAVKLKNITMHKFCISNMILLFLWSVMYTINCDAALKYRICGLINKANDPFFPYQCCWMFQIIKSAPRIIRNSSEAMWIILMKIFAVSSS